MFLCRIVLLGLMAVAWGPVSTGSRSEVFQRESASEPSTSPVVCTQSPEPEQDRPASKDARLSDDEIEKLTRLGYIETAPVQADVKRNGVTIHDRNKAYSGYTLCTYHRPCRADLVDMDGKVCRTWEARKCKWWSRAEILPNGDVIVMEGGGLVSRYSWDGRLIWKKHLRAHHDVEPLSGDRLLLLARAKRVLPQQKRRVIDNMIAIVSGDGVQLESLSLYDAMTSGPRAIQPDIDSAPDVLHANSLEWIRRPDLAARSRIYGSDNILVSVRNQDRIIIVDWQKKELVWEWGHGILDAPHDARLVGTGNILLFDNGRSRGWSRVLEVDPRTKEIVWEFGGRTKEDFFSSTRGTVQRLPNGNTLICISNLGRAIEVTRDKEIVWEYWNPVLKKKRRVPFRTERYDAETVRRLEAQKYE